MIPYTWFTQATERTAPYIDKTPLTGDPESGLYIKWENHQVTGSFKIRGALNKVLSLQPWERERGLVTASAGNHGQGVAMAGKLVGARVLVFASEHAVPAKLEAMRDLGAELRLVSGGYGEAEQAGLEYAASSGATWVSPYNDGQVIAGQGTLALEILQERPELSSACWIVPAGGGGLIAGIGAVLKSRPTPPNPPSLLGKGGEGERSDAGLSASLSSKGGGGEQSDAGPSASLSSKGGEGERSDAGLSASLSSKGGGGERTDDGLSASISGKGEVGRTSQLRTPPFPTREGGPGGLGPTLIGVQSEASPFLHSLYHSGTQEGVIELPSLADGLSGPVEDGSVTIPLVRDTADDFVLVSEAEIEQAIAYAWRRYQERIEGAAAAALAAAISDRINYRPAVILISGGNIQPEVFERIVTGDQ